MFLSIFLFIHFLSQYMLYFKSYPLYSYNWPWDLKEVLEMLLLCKELLLWRSEHYSGSSTLIRRPNKITLRTSGDLLVLWICMNTTLRCRYGFVLRQSLSLLSFFNMLNTTVLIIWLISVQCWSANPENNQIFKRFKWFILEEAHTKKNLKNKKDAILSTPLILHSN